jgi:hypothetical protein
MGLGVLSGGFAVMVEDEDNPGVGETSIVGEESITIRWTARQARETSSRKRLRERIRFMDHPFAQPRL